MKLVTKFLGILFLMLAVVTLKAGVEPVLDIKHKTSQTFILKVEGLQNQYCSIKLIDKNGIVLQNEQVEDQEIYKKLYNLKKLPIGDYTVRVESEQKIILQTISVTDKYLNVATGTKKEIYKPRVHCTTSILDINMLHFENSPANFKLLDQNYNLIFEEDLQEFGSINKRYDLKKLPAATYLVEISTNNYTYNQTLTLDK